MVKCTKVGHISMFNIFIKCKVAFETDAFSAFFGLMLGKRTRIANHNEGTQAYQRLCNTTFLAKAGTQITASPRVSLLTVFY